MGQTSLFFIELCKGNGYRYKAQTEKEDGSLHKFILNKATNKKAIPLQEWPVFNLTILKRRQVLCKCITFFTIGGFNFPPTVICFFNQGNNFIVCSFSNDITFGTGCTSDVEV